MAGHGEAPSVEIRRAINHRKIVEEELASGRDILSENVQEGTKPPEAWSSVLARITAGLEEWEDVRKNATSTHDCSVMITYVDDCALDGEARRRKAIWTIIRLIFDSGNPMISSAFLSFLARDLRMEVTAS